MGVFQGEGAVVENAVLLRGHPHEFCFTPPFGAHPTTQTTGQGANTQQTHPHLGMRGGIGNCANRRDMGGLYNTLG